MSSQSTFIDFRAVKAAVSMEQILGHYNLLETLTGSGDVRRGPCPIHNGSNKTQFSVNLAKNLWNCFSDCHCGGNVLDFVSKREGVDIHKAALLLCEWFGLKIESSRDSKSEPKESKKSQAPAERKSETPKPDDRTPNKPLGFTLKDLNPTHAYLEERGISPELAKEFGVGFFPGSKGLMVGRVVFEIHNPAGQLVAYAGRFPGTPPADDVPKYKLPPGFKKTLELYNIHRVAKQADEQPFLIVEGFFGCIHLWRHGAKRVVALMGSSMSTEQEDIILKHTSPKTHIVIALDENDAGRAARGEIAARLALHRFVRVPSLPKEDDQPTDLTPDQIQSLLKNGSLQ